MLQEISNTASLSLCRARIFSFPLPWISSAQLPCTCDMYLPGWEPTHKPQNTSARQPGKVTIACHCTGWKKRLEKNVEAHRGYRGQPKIPPPVSREYYCFMKGCQVRGKAFWSCFHCVLVKSLLIPRLDLGSISYIFFEQFGFMILVDSYFLYILTYVRNICKNEFLLPVFMYQNLCFIITLDTTYDKHNEGDSHVG